MASCAVRAVPAARAVRAILTDRSVLDTRGVQRICVMGLPPHIHAVYDAVYDAVMEGRYEYSLVSPEDEHIVIVVRREGAMVAFDEWGSDAAGGYFYMGLTHYPRDAEYRVVEGYRWRGWSLNPR